MQQCFFINVLEAQKVVKEYRDKYNKIEHRLEEHPEILNSFHEDLEDFGSCFGRESKYSSEQILRMIIIKFIETVDYRDLVIRVSGSDFLRNFACIGMGEIMHYSFICSAFKCISSDTWQKMNDLLFASAKEERKISGECLRLDSTVSESNIHYPTDASLLWDSYRVVSRLIRQCNEMEPALNLGYRFHDRKIKRLFTYISTHWSKKARSTRRKVKRYIRQLIERVMVLYEKALSYIKHARDIVFTNVMSSCIIAEIKRVLSLVKNVIDQSYRSAINGEKVPASERTFSIFEEHTELLKRGKANKPVEFGHMVTIGQTREKFITYYNVEKKSRHDIEIKDIALEDHKNKFGSYPSKFTADKNYYVSMDDINQWEEDIDVYAICKKGNRTAEEINREHSKEFQAMQSFRAGCEGSISVLKRAFGLKKCFFKGFKSFAAAVGCIVFCHNLVLLGRL